MCGLAGLIRPEVAPGDIETVRRMAEVLRHRGPDAGGLEAGDGFVLGHRRLAIIDIEAGTQPMASQNGEHWIAYNGEVYNFADIARDLEASGIVLRTRSDTEVVVEALALWGLTALERFNGMFAIAWVDTRANMLRLIRDRLGIKPLYWARTHDSLVFASEAPALFEHPELTAEPDPVGVSAFLSYRHALDDRSLYRGVRQVPAGGWLEAASDTPCEPRVARWWELPVPDPDTPRPRLADARAEVEQLFVDAVEARMIADVPLGAYLSGGLDSSLVVAAMTEVGKRPVQTFTIGFADEGFSELEWARAVAEHCGARHTEIEVGREDYLGKLDAAIARSGGPLAVPNEVPLLELSFAMKRVFSVVLSGEGADELFGGYGRIFRSAGDAQAIAALAANPELVTNPTVQRFLASAREAYGDPLPADHVELFFDRYRYMPVAAKNALLAPELRAEIGGEEVVDAPIRAAFARVAHLDPIAQYMHVFQVHHLQGLLRRLDRMTMAAGLEARVPFVDHRLIQAVQQLPVDWKLHWRSAAHRRAAAGCIADDVSEHHDVTKWILREALGHRVPPAIVERRKVGFPVPITAWFGGKREGTRWMLDVLGEARTRERGVFDPKAVASIATRIERGEASGRESRDAFYVCCTELWLRGLVSSSSSAAAGTAPVSGSTDRRP